MKMWVLQTVHRKFYKGLTRNPEIGNTTEFCPICRDWVKLGIAILAWMSLMKCCWRLQNVKCYSFYRFWVFKEKPTGEGGKITPSLPSRSKSNRLKDWNRHEMLFKNVLREAFIATSHQKNSPEIFYKMNVPRNFAKSTGKQLSCKPPGCNSSIGVFLWILRKFWEHLFCRTSANEMSPTSSLSLLLLSVNFDFFFVKMPRMLHWTLGGSWKGPMK